jgi:hypothetical protein
MFPALMLFWVFFLTYVCGLLSLQPLSLFYALCLLQSKNGVAFPFGDNQILRIHYLGTLLSCNVTEFLKSLSLVLVMVSRFSQQL